MSSSRFAIATSLILGATLFAQAANAQSIRHSKRIPVDNSQTVLETYETKAQAFPQETASIKKGKMYPDEPMVYKDAEYQDIIEPTNKEYSYGFVRINPTYGKHLLSDERHQTGKVDYILESRKNGSLSNKTAVLSGLLKGAAIAETTNEDGKFPILSRLPGQHSGTTGSKLIVRAVRTAVTAAPSNWLTMVGQFDYLPTAFPGSNDLRVTKAYAVLGDLKKSPFYATFGRNTIEFGHMGSYTPYSQSVNQHSFYAQSDDPIASIGYSSEKYQVVATAIPGGRHLRVADHPVENHISNFALNGRAKHKIGKTGQIEVGAGYLHGTIYNSTTPHHTETVASTLNRIQNGAISAWAEYENDRFAIMAELTRTVDPWLATDEIIKTMTFQGQYKTSLNEMDARLSGSFGYTLSGPKGEEYHDFVQAVAGAEIDFAEGVTLGTEYVYNRGFVPLIAITQASDASVESHSLLLNGKFSF